MRLLSFYNNLFAGPAPGGYGYVLANSDAFALADYNGFGPIFKASTVPPAAHTSGGNTSYSTLAAYAAGIGGLEAHSAQITPQFVGPAFTAAGYQLVPNSPGWYSSTTPGRVGGIPSGGAVHLGAWDGLVTSVGCNFVPAPAPPSNFYFNDMSLAGLSLTPRGMYPIGGWLDYTGTDSLTGLTQPRCPNPPGPGPWGPTAAYQTDSIQIIATNPLIDITCRIRTDFPGPTGVIEPCTEFVYVNPYNDNVGGTPGGHNGNTAQLSYMTFPDPNVAQSMVYHRTWYWLQADFISRVQSSTNNNGFTGMGESKTNSTERHSLLITKVGGGPLAGQVVWQLSHNSAPSAGPFTDYYDALLSPSSSNFAPGQTAPAPIPVGQWFMVEWAHKFVPGQPGWMWLAINGVQVFYELAAHWDPKLGERMNRIFQFQAYSALTRGGSAGPFTMLIGGGKVHGHKFSTSWPSDATLHPNVT